MISTAYFCWYTPFKFHLSLKLPSSRNLRRHVAGTEAISYKVAMANIPYFTFNNGQKVPPIGMGCWMGEVGGGELVKDMCTKALAAGYRHFDTAAGYANEEQVGKAIRESGIPREELFVTTKLGFDHTRVREAFEESLQQLGLDYIDLYLVHWPHTIVDGMSTSV
ncbi:hypothetical protein EVG20_g6805 [Dentipellis fragilis]|uniref:NADP-dependent oxidoreductase domain-containing protein n=1 Tax=Dentipellis fragilis TaxID=205917 RepID=A0A4Y9YJK1_9AGAM|nr:hypothetical protein EVG20_g6805 [Dentipellis fragilis]